MTRVALVFGGKSPEHEVSIVSARYVHGRLREAGLSVLPVGVDRAGGWHVGHDAFEILYRSEGRPRRAPGPPPTLDADVVFPLIHGVTGEDGVIQGYCEVLGMPYVGGSQLNAALCWDKIATRTLLTAHGIPQLPFLSLYHGNYVLAHLIETIEAGFGFPVFVKPTRTGSSIGISKVAGPDSLAAALDHAFTYDYRVIVEPGLAAREIEIAGYGGAEPFISVPAEIIPENEFYDFEEKYLNGRTTFVVPAHIDPDRLARLREIAARAWVALDCFGMARIDFLVTEDEIYLNEVNTVPGFTDISMYPRLLRESGVPTPELMRRLVELALARETLMPVETAFATGRDWFKEPSP